MKKFRKAIAFILALLLLLSIVGCSSGKSESEKENDPSKKETFNVNISKTPAEKLKETLKDYEDPNGCFTAKVPEGWKVSTGGYDMFYWIRIFNPENENLQVFALIKANCILADQASKDFYEPKRALSAYTMFADMILAESVEDFYKNFTAYSSFLTQYEPTYKDFEFPQISEFEVLEKLPYESYVSENCFDNSLLHATFTNPVSNGKGEGLFSGAMCLDADLGMARMNCVYNVNGISAPYGEFSEYKDVLLTIFSSINYTDTFISTVMTDQQIKAAGESAVANTLKETSDIVTNGWNARQKTYDIISEKYSDSTLGYERVYDVETGEVYRAYNGFSEIPDVDNYYKPITDDMYSDPIVGYIEK